VKKGGDKKLIRQALHAMSNHLIKLGGEENSTTWLKIRQQIDRCGDC